MGLEWLSTDTEAVPASMTQILLFLLTLSFLPLYLAINFRLPPRKLILNSQSLALHTVADYCNGRKIYT